MLILPLAHVCAFDVEPPFAQVYNFVAILLVQCPGKRFSADLGQRLRDTNNIPSTDLNRTRNKSKHALGAGHVSLREVHKLLVIATSLHR